RDFPTNRAYLELLAQHRDITEQEMVLRCNLVSVDREGKLLSFNGEGLTLKQMKEVALLIAQGSKNIECVHLSGYRNLLITDKNSEFMEKMAVKPPHESVGENIEGLLFNLKNNSLVLKDFLIQAREKMRKLEKNGVHYELYPWGASVRTVMPAFSQIHCGMLGATICSAEIVKGIADSLKMERPKLIGATGETDTDLQEKATVTLQMLQTHDFVMTHFNGSDEAAHRKNYTEKADFIARIDKEFLAEVLTNITVTTRVFICGDHGTSSLTGKHLVTPVPFIAGTVAGFESIRPIKTYQDIWGFLYERGNK
ncbi:MAG: hypothetical protein WC127_09035, partial [Acidaminococcaceae bacterium]